MKVSSLEKNNNRKYIPILGPYAAALSYVLKFAHKTRISKDVQFQKKY
jgi:hypothetical protein